MAGFLAALGVRLPIIQAPMAGTSTPAMAAAVNAAGGLGSIAVGAGSATAAGDTIRALKALTAGAFNVNLFCHRPARRDAVRDAAWLAALAGPFARFGAAPPAAMDEIYTSFLTDDDMLAQILAERPAVVSFHFGLPPADRVQALREAGIRMMATATCPAEADQICAAGLDAIVAQGIEAGGHRGIFHPESHDPAQSTADLVRSLVGRVGLPVIAAGGLMTGGDIAAMRSLGAEAAQLGTAFIACPESSADAAHRQALLGDAAGQTVITSAISGRPARCLTNGFTRLASDLEGLAPPDYPLAYDVGKALNLAARAAGDFGFGAHWAGAGADRARALPVASLMAALEAELDDAEV
jgi:nitronate monooxygenase